MISYGKHAVDETDIKAVVDVLRHQFLTQGSVVPQFEKALCEYTGAEYCTAVNSATSGLHVACLAAGVGLALLIDRQLKYQPWLPPCASSAKCSKIDSMLSTRSAALSQLQSSALVCPIALV